MPKTARSQAELEQHLADQLELLEASANDFDGGRSIEYRRMAVSIRVLLHDTGRSKSLLGLLGRKHPLAFIDTALPYEPGNPLAHSGLTVIQSGGSNPGQRAPLDREIVGPPKSFDDWWNATIIRDDQARLLSRKDLICTAANQDGGAHVDADIDEAYGAIAKENSLSWLRWQDSRWMPELGGERAAIRQIAHEVLKTLKPDYVKRADHGGAALVIGGMRLVMATPEEAGAIERRRKLKRNDPCNCNSGLKFKHCHGASLGQAREGSSLHRL